MGTVTSAIEKAKRDWGGRWAESYQRDTEKAVADFVIYSAGGNHTVYYYPKGQRGQRVATINGRD